VAGARAWAQQSGSNEVRLSHFLLSLLDEEEGRPAVLLERAGLSVVVMREKLTEMADAPPAPPDHELFNAARNWSLAHRHDSEFLTDALLISVLRANPGFEQEVALLGLDAAQLERILGSKRVQPKETSSEEQGEPFSMSLHMEPFTETEAGRVLDANFNRAREATRVLEDYCRFVLNDRFLTEQLKELRHELVRVLEKIPAHLLTASRETQSDVGTSVSAHGEYERSSLPQIAVVNGKRLQEALRSLEEFGKLFAADLGGEFEKIRYRSYTLERSLVVGGRSREKLSSAKLYALLTGAQCQASLDWVIEQSAMGGVDVIQLREKTLCDRELLVRAQEVRRWTRKAGVLFIVNDRPDIARLAEADGVHLGQDDMTVRDARKVVGADALIGVSTHTLEQVRQAVLDGANYIGIGPVFPSRTKEFGEFPGLDFVRAAVAETSLPAFALGGIEPSNIDQVVQVGVTRVAVSSVIARSEDPEQVCRLLRSRLSNSTALGEGKMGGG
jgi:thiamine-phosphate pyrophosphorylase